MQELLIMIFSIWLLCLGLAIMLQQHKWFLKWSQKTAKRILVDPIVRLLDRNKGYIFAFVAGAMFLLWLLSQQPPQY